MPRANGYVNVSLLSHLYISFLLEPFPLFSIPCSLCSLLTDRCHCGACQAFTSSAFSIGLVVPAPAFELSDPAHLLKTYEDEDPATMAGNRIAFCGKCGCYLMHEPVFPLVRRDLFIRRVSSCILSVRVSESC